MEAMPEIGIWGLQMKYFFTLILATALVGSVAAQQASPTGAGSGPTVSGDSGAIQPVERVGPDDLLGITVYDAPELSRAVRVDAEGDIRLPMVQKHIHAAGLYPSDLEKVIGSTLIEENVLVNPIVTVSVMEYRSRPITIAGAVKAPLTFQATGTVTLLDAISRAGGLAENAGPEILVSRPSPTADDKSGILTKRISAQGLMNGDDPSLNLRLEGGEDIRVPEAGKIFVAGNVKHPGAYSITDGSESSVLKALALSNGLDSYSAHMAYIYRTEAGSGGKSEIPIDLKKIVSRKAPDVPLYANDMLYVSNSNGKRVSAQVLAVALGAGIGIASLAIMASHY